MSINKILKSIQDVLKEVNNYNGEYYYRGFKDESQIMPRLGRWKLEKFENDLLYDFINLDLFKKNIIQVESILDIIELAQHYGIPTRFLDWSSDLKVALYFANFNHKDENCITYVAKLKKDCGLQKIHGFDTVLNDIDNCKLGELDDFTLEELDQLDIMKKGSDKQFRNNHFLLYKLLIKRLPKYTLDNNVSFFLNPRKKAQQGVFTIHKDANAGVNIPLEVLELRLTANEKANLLSILSEMEVNEDKLFPDDKIPEYKLLEAECKEIVKKYSSN